MKVYCPVSIGELCDKFSILTIKMNKINDPDKLRFLNAEIKELHSIIASLNLENIHEAISNLERVNRDLWDLEEKIRFLRINKEDKEELSEIALLIAETNDKRFSLKNKINNKYLSAFREVKSFD